MPKYIALSVLSGILLSISWPTHGFPILIFVAFVPLIMAEHQLVQKDIKWKTIKIFFLGYLCFLIWNGLSLTWLYNALQRDENGVYQNSLSAYLFPVLVNGLLMALTFQLYHWVKKKAGNYYGLFFLPCIWMAFENLHLNWEIAFPWFNLGNVFAQYPEWVQWYEYTGVFGGTLWVWVVNLVLFYCFTAFKNTNEKQFIYKALGSSVLIIGIPIAISYAIFYNYEEKGEEITALVLQPELNPYTEKYNTDSQQIVSDLIRLTNEHITDSTQFVVAPETAFPGPGPGLVIDNLTNDFLLNRIKNNLKPYPNTTFVSGVELWNRYMSEQAPTPTARRYGNSVWWVDVYNSSIQVNQKDSIEFYHKSKLLVGIETFPYATILKPLLGELLLNFGGTVGTHGIQKEREVFTNSFNSAKIAPMICYESVFGDYTTNFVKNGANVLFIMSNDSWWDESDGHRELLLYGNLRAIENRRSIVRSANSGISGFINQKGEIKTFLPYGIEGALEGKVKLNDKLTIYTKYGDYIARIALLFLGIILAYTISLGFIGRLKKR